MATMTPKAVALEFGASAKTLRKFLRQDMPDKAPGKGGRWEIEARSLKSLKKRFDAWSAEEARKRQEARDAAEADATEEEVLDEAETLDEAESDAEDEVLDAE